MNTSIFASETGSRRSAACASALALGLAVFLTCSTDAAASGDEVPVWVQHRPPSTLAYFKFGPDRLEETLQSFATRFRIDQYNAEHDPAAAMVAAAMINDNPGQVLFNDSPRFRELSFEHLDESREVVFASSVVLNAPAMERLQIGLPPLSEHITPDIMLIRGFFPADDGEALAAELREFCRRLSPKLHCSQKYELTERGDWVQLDLPIPGDAGEVFEIGTADGAPETSTPAFQSFLDRDSGAAVYVTSEAIHQFLTFVRVDQIERRFSYVKKNGGDRDTGRYHSVRDEIAEAMLVAATEEPSLRESAGFTLSMDGRRDRLRFDLVQSYTAYGRSLADAGETEIDIPKFDGSRSAISAAWRFDLPSALSEARRPLLGREKLLGPPEVSVLRHLLRYTDNMVLIRMAATRPVSMLAAALEVAQRADLPQFLKPEAYTKVVGGTVELDIDSEALVQGNYSGIPQGGVALGFSDARAVGPILNLVDTVQIATGFRIHASTGTNGDFSILTLRPEPGGEFVDDEETGDVSARASVRGDWLLALLEVLWSEGDPLPVREEELTYALDAVRDAEFATERGRAGRHWRLESGGLEGPPVELSGGDAELPDPAERPECLERAIVSSVRTYVSEVAGLSTSGSPMRVGPSTGSSDDTTLELEGDARRLVEELVERLDEQEAACAEAGEPWNERFAEIRDYWRGVLDGSLPLQPSGEGE